MVPNSSTEIKTIRVWGFPNDVRKREITNILKYATQGLIGYEIYRVEEMIVVFALYEDLAAADSAVISLNNMMFDEENVVVLHADMGSDDIPETDCVCCLVVHPSAQHIMQNLSLFHRSKELIGKMSMISSLSAYYRDVSTSPSVASPSFDERYYPKSNAVFFVHLDKNLSEDDLIKLRDQFSSLPGYQFMDTDHQEDDIICYVMFEDEDQAKAAKAITARLCLLPSSAFTFPHAKLGSLFQGSKELNAPSAQNRDVSTSPSVASPSSDERYYPKSNALFIVHLDKNLSEDDLIKLSDQFSSLPGYQFMDTDHRADDIICYVMFEDEDHAKAAKDGLSGVVCCGVIHAPIDLHQKNPIQIIEQQIKA